MKCVSFSNWWNLVHVHKTGELRKKLEKLQVALKNPSNTNFIEEIKSRLKRTVWYFTASARILDRYDRRKKHAKTNNVI